MSSTSRATAKKSRSNRTSAITIAIWFVAFVAVAAVAGQRLLPASTEPAPAPTPPPVASAAQRATTIIVSTPNSDECRHYRMAIDRGVVHDQGLGECAVSAGDQGTRVETISKGFRNR
jgi:hypothetical protein